MQFTVCKPLFVLPCQAIGTGKPKHCFTAGNSGMTTKILRIMKVTAFFLFVAFMHVQAAGYGQGITLNVKDKPLEEVFKEIRKQTGYQFFYSDVILNDVKKVTLYVKGATIEEVLKKCFQWLPLEYSIKDKTIVVRRKQTFRPSSVNDIAPPIDVKGRIVDNEGNPVIATVQAKGTSNAVSTNEKGDFFIENINEDAILVISGVSIETFEVPVKGKNDLAVLTVNLKVKEMANVEVTVNTGYQQIPKERATGSFVPIDKELLNRRVSTDVISRLEGVASGVLFNKNIQPGSNIPPVSIRGNSTIYANTRPLIVIDNFPYDGDISNINPNDIENITILRDAAASSIWGAFSGNGVIVITTKKGRLNQPIRVSFNANTTFSEKPDLFYSKTFLNSSDFIDVERMLYNQGFYAPLVNSFDKAPLSPVIQILLNRDSGLITNTDAENQINNFRNADIRNDLNKYFYRQAVNQQYNVQFEGGTDKSSYFFSAGFDNNDLSQVNNKYTRVTLNSLLGFQITSRLSLQAGVNYINGINKSDNTLNQIRTDGSNSKSIYPYATLTDDFGNYMPIVKDYQFDYIEASNANNFLNWKFFPLEELRNRYNVLYNKTNEVRITTNLRYTVLKNLSAEIKYQFQNTFADGRQYYDPQSYYARNLINRFSSLTNDLVSSYNVPMGGIMDLNSSNLTSHSGRAQLSYSKRTNNFTIDGIAGTEIREIRNEVASNRLYGYDPNTSSFKQVNYTQFFPLNPSGFSNIPNPTRINQLTDRFRSFFGNLAFGIFNKYTVSVSGRIDQSNLFGVKTNQKTLPLWSSGIKWKVDNEKFYNFRSIPELVVRLTYGYNGNLTKSVTAFTTAIYSSSTDIFGNPYTYANIVFPGNPELRWEKIRMLNLGIDFGSINNIITGSVEFYHKNGSDIIGDAAIPSSTGYSVIRGNFSSIKGKGLDITINSKNLNKNLKWLTSLLISYSSDKVTRYTGMPDFILVEGRPRNSIYSFPWKGLDPVTGDPLGYIGDSVSKEYGAILNQKLSDRIFHGSSIPTLFGGLRNIFTWRSFSVSANIIFKARYYFVRNSISYASLFNSWIGHEDFTKRWQKPGDEINTSVPSMPLTTNINRDAFYSQSEVLVEKGDHIRLQDISVSYDFLRAHLSQLKFSKLQLYLYANNLGLLWAANDEGIDPDYIAPYPNPKSISIGVRASF